MLVPVEAAHMSQAPCEDEHKAVKICVSIMVIIVISRLDSRVHCSLQSNALRFGI